MKPDIHPEYREVLFHDTSSDTYFVIGSTVETNDTRDMKGRPTPICPWIFLALRIRFTRASRRSRRAMARVARFNKRFGDRSLKG